MLHMILGRVGEGKTLYAMRLITNVLLYQERTVVTSIDSIDLGALNEYLQERCAKMGRTDKPDLRRRLVIIEKHHSGQYFRYRGCRYKGPEINVTPRPDQPMPEAPSWPQLPYGDPFTLDRVPAQVQRQRGGMGIDEFDEYMRLYFESAITAGARKGCVYFIDEAQDHFPARQWDEIGRSVSYHVTKHRHLDDDIYLMTQAPEKIDTDLRRLASRWHVVRNNYNVRVLGVKAPQGFVVKSYYDLPGKHDMAFETSKYRLDLRLASCYKTRGAFRGVDQSPETKITKGLPFWTLPVGAVAALLLVMSAAYFAPAVFNKIIGHIFFGGSSTPAETVVQADKGTVSKPIDTAKAPAAAEVATVSTQSSEAEKPTYRIGGMVEGPNGVSLSVNGRWLKAERVNEKEITLADGTRISLADYKKAGL